MKKDFTAIIQARLGSERFPKKVLEKLEDQSLVQFLNNRLMKSKHLSNIIFAIPEKDTALETEINHIGADYFKGSEHDVLERFINAAEHFDIEHIVRITADCPLTDPEMLDDMIEIYSKYDYPYISNSLPPTFPDGFDIEIFKYELLKEVHQITTNKHDREHVTSYIRNNKKIPKYNYESDIDYSDIRLTVDTPKDLELLRVISSNIPCFTNATYKEIILFMDKHPELRKINNGSFIN